MHTGTKLTCQGGQHGAGIGGSKVGIKKFSQGHGVNLHFGSLATNIYGGEIFATSGVGGAGIGGGANGGVGEWIYVYSGKLTAISVSQGAGIGGGQGGPGRHIYIRGGTVDAGSQSGGAGIGSGDQDGQNKPEDAHHIEISGGTVDAWSNYAGAGIGGGVNGNSGNILIKDTTLTAQSLPLFPSSSYKDLPAAAVGRGSNRTHWMSVMQNQEYLMHIEENIKIGASDGKSVWLSATGWQWRRSQGPYEWGWGTTTELLIPNENGRVDLQRLSLPYAYNYGRVIGKLELRCEESTHNHEFVWANRDDCHIWVCKNCGARDPAAEMSKQNAKHTPSGWSNPEQLCAVCGHVLERDTKAPVMETLTDGESYTVEDNIDGNPGAYTFTVSDPAASGEMSSGIKSVTINGEPQDGPTYRLPAPDGGNNDAGAEYTVVATDNAGNETTATVRTYRWHHVKVISPDGNGIAFASPLMAVAGTEITLTAMPKEGYHFKEWQVISGGVTIANNKFIMPEGDVKVKAIFEADAPPAPTDPAKPSISVIGTYTYNGSEHTATVNGYDPTTMDISGNTGTDAGDYTVRVTSKTGKWADGNTDAVTAAWSIGKATQEAPIGLNGVAPTTVDGSDGKISGVTDKMEYRMAGESIYTPCSGTEIENLSADNYFVRYAEDNNHFASSDAEVTVGEGASLADCTITFNAGDGSGSMDSVIVKAETNYILPACGFTAPADQEFKAWQIGGTEYKVGDSYTVLGDTEIKALWENSVITPTTYTVTVSNDGTGTATPSTAVVGTEIRLTATPKTGYHLKEWEVISGNVTIKDDKFTMPSANVEVKAIFEKDAPTEFTITFDGNGGTPYVGSMTTTNQKLTSPPSASRSGSYSFDGWYTEKNGGTRITTDTVFHADTTVYAHWTYTGGGGSSYSYYTIKATAGAGGSISPSGNVSVREGRDQTFTITPDKGYAVANVKIDGKSIGAVKSYTFENVRRTHTIEVIFMKANGNPQTGVFVDVATGSYYEDAVDWAVENGITTGVSANRFDPNGVCTRAQAVTFLWRAAGSPAPRSRTMPFTDVPAGNYYYDAVLWAAENGITKGTSDTTFSPNMTCTRAQIVAFLWRSEKAPAAGSRNPFADVKSSAYYADAVLWALREDITKGTTSTTFSPDADCTRAQIVTFLWRCKK